MKDLIYKRGEISSKCYLLKKKRKVVVEFTPDDLWSHESENIIVGALELVLESIHHTPYNRLYTLYINDKHEGLMEISKEMFYSLLKRYEAGRSLSVYFCQMFSVANDIFLDYKEREGNRQRAYEDRAKLYYTLVNEFEELTYQFQFGDMVKMLQTFQNEIFYEMGKIYSEQDETHYLVKQGSMGLNHFEVNTKLCEQGDAGKELFILQQGEIQVFIDGDKVTTIDKPGTVIGELAFFLGRKRAATLIVSKPSDIVILEREAEKDFYRENPDFFMKVVMSVSVQVYRLLSKITAIYETIAKRQKRSNPNLLPDFVVSPPGEDKLVHFCSTIEAFSQKKNLQALKDFIEKHQKWFDMYLSLRMED